MTVERVVYKRMLRACQRVTRLGGQYGLAGRRTAQIVRAQFRYVEATTTTTATRGGQDDSPSHVHAIRVLAFLEAAASVDAVHRRLLHSLTKTDTFSILLAPSTTPTLSSPPRHATTIELAAQRISSFPPHPDWQRHHDKDDANDDNPTHVPSSLSQIMTHVSSIAASQHDHLWHRALAEDIGARLPYHPLKPPAAFLELYATTSAILREREREQRRPEPEPPQ